MSRVFIQRFGEQRLAWAVDEAFKWLGVDRIVKPDSRVFLKPNLTWKDHLPGVTTTPAALEAVVVRLRDLTSHVTVGESNGGQDCFWAEDAFRSHGLYALQQRLGIGVVNLSKAPTAPAETTVRGRVLRVSLPAPLLHETDVFITMPVPKIHAMTRVSLTLKNQWGCLGNSMRVTEHPRFPELIVAINKLLQPKLSICDGTFFLDQTGPLIGEPVPMNLLLVGDGVGAAALACCRVMGVDANSVKHFEVARAEGLFPASDGEVQFNAPPEQFATRKFRLKRAAINYVHLLAFRNRALNSLFYDSLFADGLHRLLWAVRSLPVVDRSLYGRYGHGEANRHGAY